MLDRIEKILARLGMRSPAPQPQQDEPDPLPIASDALARQLGLHEDSQPVRMRPRWRVPPYIVVMGASPRRLRWLQQAAAHVRLIEQPWNTPPGEQALAADAIIGWCTNELLSRATELRWIHLCAAGVEEVLRLPSLRGRDVVITNLQRAASPVIAEHAFAMLLSLCRQMPEHLQQQRRRKWSSRHLDAERLRSLGGRTLLVAGLGGIGQHVAEIASGFGMRVLATRARADAAPPACVQVCAGAERLWELAATADVVINTLPLTPQTRLLFDASFFSAMKRGALFVNVARGASVVTDDLTAALRSGHLGGAALDVVEPEPLPAAHPLWRIPNVVITPHVAGWGRDTQEREWLITRENLCRYVAGERLLSVVDVERGY